MAVPNSRRFVVEGSLPGGETFAFSWAAVGPVVVGASAQDIADAVVANTAFTAFVTALKPFMHTGTTLQRLRCYFYANDGTLSDSGAADVASGVGTGSFAFPNQCALALSLRTATNTRSGRGRMYVPCTSGTVDKVSGKLTNTRAPLATATADLMEYTVGQVASETQGIIRPVTSVRVGDVVDTIRGRREGLTELYAVAPV